MNLGINTAKKLRVVYGPQHNPQTSVVQLNGVDPDEQLTPKLARRASRVAHGSDSDAIVWDAEHGHGYRLYRRSARKLYADE